MLVFLYKADICFLIVGAQIKIEDFRIKVSQIPAMLGQASKAFLGIPMLEGCSLTWNDPDMQENNMQHKRLEQRSEEDITAKKMKNVAMRAGIRKNCNV